jgi:ribosomal protein L3 glutamine methyltransferase
MTDHTAADDHLISLRDWLRYAVSRFNEAGLVYGHGTSNALDEAAFLILHTLHLPIDQLDPWLDARLLPSERVALNAIIERRITTRKPAPYLTNEAWAGGHAFYVDERVIVPRSLIAELLHGGLDGSVEDPAEVRRVLEICTGSGCLAILAALAFENAAVEASDLSEDALAVARRNVDAYGLTDRVSLFKSDLFKAHEGKRFDLILANPPYVTEASQSAFPPEYAAEPAMAHAGGADGLDVVRRILAQAGGYLAPEGVLIVEIGTGRERLEQDFPDVPFQWLDTSQTQGEVFSLTADTLPATASKLLK